MTAFPTSPMQMLPQAQPVTGQPVLNEAMRQHSAALLQHTYRWLETAVPVAPQLSSMVPPLVRAVQLYQAQQYDPCLRQVSAVIGGLRRARMVFPALPPL